ncbi:Phosphatidylinositol-Binding Clathrin Assembly Protein [Manis pentadactyla]|nr:Phosphatidylinositol-Binding Clathrin Assembly Protein [Manis pentadactyla]
MGASASKAALGATTDEPSEPEPKHLADLIKYINETNMSVEHLADVLCEKTRSSSWVVVFKALVTVHHLMMHGNEANPDELTNGVIRAAFMLLFKDSLLLFAAYNDGILNLLGKYFDMRRNQCKESLDIYIKFLGRTTKLAQSLKVAEQVGIDQKKIPYVTEAPHSLLEALKQHLASLEKKNDILPPYSLQYALMRSIPNNPFVKASASRPSSAVTSQPTLPSQALKPAETIVANNPDGSPASLVENRNFGESLVNKSDIQWCQPSKMEISGGINQQLNTRTCTSAIWKPASLPSVLHMVPPPTGAPSVMVPQPMFYTQPGLKTSNLSTPFTRNKTQSI